MRELKVGDKILIENWFNGKRVVTITRVTKTKAVAHIVRNDNTSYDYSFDKVVGVNNEVKPKPRIDFDTTKRTLIS